MLGRFTDDGSELPVAAEDLGKGDVKRHCVVSREEKHWIHIDNDNAISEKLMLLFLKRSSDSGRTPSDEETEWHW